MRRYLFGMLVAVAGAAGTAGAQGLATSPCPPGSTNALGIPDQQRVAADACTQAYDFFQFIAPQLGISLAGGNATLGQGGTMGGLGHFSLGLRGNVVQGRLPDVGNFTQSSSGAQRRNLATNDQIVGLPTADVAIGVFKGIPLGLTNVGGVDILASVGYVPTINDPEFSITPSRNVQIGYGVRVGLLQESIVVPGVSLTFLKRDLPETDIVGRTGSNTLSVTDLSVKTSAWRVVASKSLVMFGVAIGAGQDMYDQSAQFGANVSGSFNGVPVSGSTTVPETKQSLTRTNFFADVSLNLPVFKLVGEVGQVSGGTVNTFNTFSGGAPDRSLVYFSGGIRLAW